VREIHNATESNGPSGRFGKPEQEALEEKPGHQPRCASCDAGHNLKGRKAFTCLNLAVYILNIGSRPKIGLWPETVRRLNNKNEN